MKSKLAKPISTVFTSVVMLTFLSPNVARADWTLNSPFALTIPSLFLDQQVANVLGKNSDLNFVIPDQVINSTITVTLSQIAAKIQSPNANITTLTSGQAWNLSLPAVNGVVNIGGISANQIIDRIVSGVHLKVRLEGTCSNITLTLPPAAAQLTTGLTLTVSGNQATAQLNGFQMNWSASAWKVSSISCQGAEGFGDAVAQYLKAYLAQPAQLQALAQGYVQSELNRTVSQSVQSVFNGIKLDTKRKDILVSLKSSSLKSVAHGYVMAGVTTIRLPLARPGQSVIESAPALPEITDAGTTNLASVTFPDSVIPSLISHLHETGLIDQTFLSSQIPSLTGFLHSGFQKFFVFPDLRKFPSEAIMHFVTSMTTPGTGTIDESVKHGTSGVSSSVQMNLSLPLRIEMQVPQGSIYENYVEFLAPLQTLASVKIENGNLVTQLTNLNLKLKATWDPTYITNHDPNKSIWLSQINGKIKNALTAQPLSYTLPPLNLGLGEIFHATGLLHDPAAKAVHVFIK
jgi:hypothetical protein